MLTDSNGYLHNLDLTGKLTMREGADIGNDGADYSITDDGFNVTENPSFLERNAYTIGDERGAFWGDGDDIILESRDLLGGNLILRSLGGNINLRSPGSVGENHIYGSAYFERFQQQEDENRALPDTGEQELEIDAPIVRLASIDNAAILARFDMGTSPNTDRSFSFVLVNDSGTNLTIRDQSSASLSGANIITPGNVDREFQQGGRLGVTYLEQTGNYHLNQDRT